MKRTLFVLALALLGASWCVAHASDAESEKRRQEIEAAKRQLEIEAARRRADEAAEAARREQPRLQHPILRYSPSEPGKLTPPSTPSGDVMFAEAAVLERQGKGAEAVRIYVRAARNGSGKAALRLAQIYDTGIPGVARDYAESRKWENAARALGEDVPMRKP